jgi:hypothetical protein
VAGPQKRNGGPKPAKVKAFSTLAGGCFDIHFDENAHPPVLDTGEEGRPQFGKVRHLQTPFVVLTSLSEQATTEW